MKLYAVARSPFGARVEAAAILKGIPLEILPPPAEGLKSPAYLAVNPMGRLPTLVLDDGRTLPESEVIVEYLEQMFPEPALLPAAPWDRARTRLIGRVAELYVMGPLFGLFRHLAAPADPAAEALFVDIERGLGHVEAVLGGQGFAWGDAPTLADCALAPFLFWVKELHRMFARPSPIGSFPKLASYDAGLQTHPVFGPLLAAMAEDLAALRAGR
ncbi:MAG: glutathione S-transferase family protein [Phenylobacterium sp.]|uniref:glutathione S-transferase family protein n=1 Tax=Phenylobacterium sp. TaxID=1871053 RepID=UPI0012206674|nr:glutathione S-transferase family protein [Phenylobacterium sp.]TAJ74325.1 MAG: glutathione S-transferase family protein [Phenylobacterium sp.]